MPVSRAGDVDADGGSVGADAHANSPRLRPVRWRLGDARCTIAVSRDGSRRCQISTRASARSRATPSVPRQETHSAGHSSETRTPPPSVATPRARAAYRLRLPGKQQVRLDVMRATLRAVSTSHCHVLRLHIIVKRGDRRNPYCGRSGALRRALAHARRTRSRHDLPDGPELARRPAPDASRS